MNQYCRISKVTNLLWRAAPAVLPTTLALHCKQVNMDVRCGWCQLRPETAVHVFFECIFAKEVREMVGMHTSIRTEENDSTMIVLKRAFNSANKEQCMMICMLCWGLWFRKEQMGVGEN